MSNGNGAAGETVTLTIDGQEVTVPKGTTLLHAAETIGVKVPHYCYHPGIPTAPAMCRMCLVEVEGANKLQPACVSQAQDEQVVRTQSDAALSMREGVLEFYLKNHPLDCPICDQSGECKLQDYVHAEGRKHGRSRDPKRVFGRDDFGGDILFYGDRCVMCTRCVRFMDEVARDPILTVVERGNRSVIDTFFEEGVAESPYAGNIVDICPVGALVSKDFLHKARAWDLDHTPSVCPNCSQGCNIDLHTRDNVVQRIKPRANMSVNGYWMCDYGRHSYEWMNRRDRIEVPLVRDEEGKMKAMGWRDALQSLLARIRKGADDVPDGESLDGESSGDSGSGGSAARGPVRAVASPFASNEDLGAFRTFLRTLREGVDTPAGVGGSGGSAGSSGGSPTHSPGTGSGGEAEAVFRSPRAEDEEPLPGFPELVRRRDLAPNVQGAEILGFRRVGDDEGRGGLSSLDDSGIIVVLGDELPDQDPTFGASADLFVYLGSYPSEAVREADFVLPVTTFAEQEGTFTNHAGRVQRFWPGLQPPGAARPAWLILSALVAELEAVTKAAAGAPGAGEPADAERAIPSTAGEAFLALADEVPEFGGLTYESLGTLGAPVNEPVPIPGD